MGYIKNNYSNLIDRDGHHIILKHVKKKLSCPNHCNGNPECPHCYGLNNFYKSKRAKIRRSEASTLESEKLEFDNKIAHSGNIYIYYFKAHVNIQDKDFIIEYKNNQLELFVVLNTDKHYGDQGVQAINTCIAAQVNIENNIIKKSLKDYLKEIYQ